MALMQNDPTGGFQGMPPQPPGGVSPAQMPGMPPGAPPMGPAIPRSMTLKEYVQMARAKKMVPAFTNVADQAGQFSEAWTGPNNTGGGNAFLQPGEYRANPGGGAPIREGSGIPEPGARPAQGKASRQIGQMSADELRNVDVYQMAMEKTRSSLPRLFKHVFGDRFQSPRDLNPAQLKHWQKSVQALNNHYIKALDKQLERNLKLFKSKDILQDDEAKAAADARKSAEADYRAWESAKSKNPLETEGFEQYRARKQAALDKVAPKPRKKQPPPVVPGEQTGIPPVMPEPIPGWGPGAVPEAEQAGPSQDEILSAADRAYKRSGGDRNAFAREFAKELSPRQAAPPAPAAPTYDGAPEAIPEDEPEEQYYD